MDKWGSCQTWLSRKWNRTAYRLKNVWRNEDISLCDSGTVTANGVLSWLSVTLFKKLFFIIELIRVRKEHFNVLFFPGNSLRVAKLILHLQNVDIKTVALSSALYGGYRVARCLMCTFSAELSLICKHNTHPPRTSWCNPSSPSSSYHGSTQCYRANLHPATTVRCTLPQPPKYWPVCPPPHPPAC